jgi:hypothetical protein
MEKRSLFSAGSKHFGGIFKTALITGHLSGVE